MGSTPLAALPYWELGDPPNGPSGLQAALLALEKKLALTFTTAAARNAAITSPVAGMLVFLTTPQQWTYYDGTGWVCLTEPAQTYAPSIAGMTLGNGTSTGRYWRSNGWCEFTARIVLGTTSTVAGPQFTIGMPIAHAANMEALWLAGSMRDVSAGLFYTGLIADETAAAGTTCRMFAAGAGAATVVQVALSSTVPFTWATGDVIAVYGRYEMNTRYL